MEKITVTNSQATAPSVPYSHLESSLDSTADQDGLDTASIGSDLVLADMSDSDFLLDEYGCVDTSRGIPKVSV